MIVNVTADPTGNTLSYNAISDAIALVTANNFDPAIGGEVHLGPGTFLVDQTIVLPSGVTLVGAGHSATFILLAAGKNIDVIQSVDFASLTGKNKWYVGADGVPYSFGLRGLTVDGNSYGATPANTSGSGVRFFGKRYVVDDVQVVNCAEYGFYSECGQTTGQTDPYNDMPEAYIGRVWVRNTGNDGFHFEGPHDSQIGSVLSSSCGGYCINFTSGAYSSATCDVGFMHGYGSGMVAGAYANGNASVQLDAAIRIGELVAESGGGNSLLVTAQGDSSQIGILRAFANGRFSGPANKICVVIKGEHVQVGNARIDDDNGAGGLSLQAAHYFQCPALRVTSTVDDNSGIGIDVDSGDNSIRGLVTGFISGTGLRTGYSAGRSNNHLDLIIETCQTGWNNVASGKNNRYNLSITVPASGGIQFTGAGAANGDDWKVVAQYDNGSGWNYLYSPEGGRPGFSSDNGNASTMVYPGLDNITQRWSTPLTVNRTCTLSNASTTPSAYPYSGAKFRVVREASATGAFTLTVASASMTSVVLAAGQWADFECDGSAFFVWHQVAFGSLY